MSPPHNHQIGYPERVRVSRTRSPFPAQVNHGWTVGSTSKYTYLGATNTGYFTKLLDVGTELPS